MHHQHLQAMGGRLSGQSNVGHRPVQKVSSCTTSNGLRWPVSIGWRIIKSKGQRLKAPTESPAPLMTSWQERLGCRLALGARSARAAATFRKLQTIGAPPLPALNLRSVPLLPCQVQHSAHGGLGTPQQSLTAQSRRALQATAAACVSMRTLTSGRLQMSSFLVACTCSLHLLQYHSLSLSNCSGV